MAEDGGHGGSHGEIVVAGGEVLGDLDGSEGLAEVEQEGGDAETLGSGAGHVGGSDIAAAGRADVLLAEDSDQQIPKGDRAQEVRQRDGDEPGDHCLLDEFIKPSKDVGEWVADLLPLESTRLRSCLRVCGFAGIWAGLEEMAADQLESVLAGPVADAITVAREVELFYLGVVAVGQSDVDEADGLVGVGAGLSGTGTGDARDGNAKGGSGAGANAFGEGAGYLGRDGAFGSDEIRGDTGEGGFESVAVDYRSAQEVAGAAGDGGEALREEAPGAALGGGEGEVAHAEVEEDDLLERLAVGGEDGVVHLGFDLFCEFVHAGLGLGEGGPGAEEVELDLAGAGEDSGLDVGVLLIDGRGAGVDLGLGDEGHAEHALCQVAGRQGLGEPGFALAVEERLQLVGRAGEEEDDLAVGIDSGVEVLAGGAAGWVLEDSGAFEHVRLLGVVRRHHHLAGGEAFVELGDDGGVAMQLDIEGAGYGLACKVVLGWAEAAGEDDDVRARDRDAGSVGELAEIVADDGLEGHRDAEVVEARSEIEGVSVLPERRKHLGADGDNFSDHDLS